MLPPPGPKQLRALLQRPVDASREAIIANSMRVGRIIGSPRYPAPEERLRGRIRSLVARALDEDDTAFRIRSHEMGNPTGLLREVFRASIRPLGRMSWEPRCCTVAWATWGSTSGSSTIPL